MLLSTYCFIIQSLRTLVKGWHIDAPMCFISIGNRAVSLSSSLPSNFSVGFSVTPAYHASSLYKCPMYSLCERSITRFPDFIDPYSSLIKYSVGSSISGGINPSMCSIRLLNFSRNQLTTSLAIHRCHGLVFHIRICVVKYMSAFVLLKIRYASRALSAPPLRLIPILFHS